MIAYSRSSISTYETDCQNVLELLYPRPVWDIHGQRHKAPEGLETLRHAGVLDASN